jgi:quinone-modifying oxidoreductase subunit QmoA
MQEETVELKVGSVVWATGWRPYDAAKIQPYGYGRIPNVVTSLEFERMADPHGPTGGKPAARRRQGGEERRLHPVRRLARREPPAPLLAHLLHGLPQADPLRARGLRRRGQVHDLLHRHPRHRPLRGLLPERAERPDGQLRQVEGGAHRLNEQTGNPVLHGVDTEGYHRYATEHDLVVLAVGMEPEVTGVKLPDDIVLDSSNFIEGSKSGGMFGAGSAASPLDVNRSVQSATAASLKAIQVIHKTASTEAA